MGTLEQLMERRKELSYLEVPIRRAVQTITNCFREGGKILICGNGGSSSDSDHIACELMKSFEMQRPLSSFFQEELMMKYGVRGSLLAKVLQQGLPAISLASNTALITAISNDMGEELIFAQQVAGLGNKGDVLLAISTSGNSQNVIDALITAKAKKLVTIGLTGNSGGKMRVYTDILINVPDVKTACVQEYHLPVYHTICRMVELELFG